MTILGQLSLGLGFLLAIWGTAVGVIGGNTGRLELVQSARRAVYALFGVMVVAALALLVALLNRDFNVEYVWSYTSRQLPTVYTISAFYGGAGREPAVLGADSHGVRGGRRVGDA